MSGELDAAGDLANAGLIAGAMTSPEPGKAGEGACLNCGAPLNGARFCSNCGQAAHANRSLWALIEELAWNVFNLDTKAWRTVPRLVFRPGTLTRSYIDGKRARYLTPLATFLLCYFFMFLVFSGAPKPQTLNLSDNNNAAEHVNDARDNLNEAQDGLREAQQELAEAQRDAGPHPSAGQQTAISVTERIVREAQVRVARRQAALERAQQRQQQVAQAPVQLHVNDSERAAIQRPNAQSGAVVSQAAATTTPAAPPSPAPSASGAALPQPPQPPASNDLNTDNGPITLDDVLRKLARDNINVDGRPWLSPAARAQLSNPPLFYSHLQDSASRWGFLLVPFSLPFIAFLFLFKKNITLYDHTVFALNSLSFASLLFALVIGASEVAWLHWLPGIAFGLGLPIHTFFHIGGAYKMKWWSALWRTFFMLFFAFFVLIIFFVAVLFIGLAG